MGWRRVDDDVVVSFALVGTTDIHVLHFRLVIRRYLRIISQRQRSLIGLLLMRLPWSPTSVASSGIAPVSLASSADTSFNGCPSSTKAPDISMDSSGSVVAATARCAPSKRSTKFLLFLLKHFLFFSRLIGIRGDDGKRCLLPHRSSGRCESKGRASSCSYSTISFLFDHALYYTVIHVSKQLKLRWRRHPTRTGSSCP
ncbi:uncharacterized protein B0H18DRAFT_374854 [Fomitopsis serialis]|uniref:uncharacterized protein n=1 Tax=Fomitopsis serialis TaxID=139415 RepID=UPI002007C14E|nr:uncharacterized protein B0H18DRAFT_374854 [Neoantrodia serialis]KAH9925493.1 hypothetical protein B0H18DRAFT_374854 [Neoantrodia serialis]